MFKCHFHCLEGIRNYMWDSMHSIMVFKISSSFQATLMSVEKNIKNTFSKGENLLLIVFSIIL